MIQIGNEVTAGILWPLGQIYQDDGQHWPEFATLMNAGIAGARAGNPRHHDLDVMIHIDRAATTAAPSGSTTTSWPPGSPTSR
jgi:arabinogalactan endo-1,4-beta-galactosidase